MLGIQVFNNQEQIYWSEEIIEFNIQWLQKLGIDLNEVTFTADCWAGGGNLGPCVEYFIHGLEVGNMVFMQFKSLPDGQIEELPVKVIDVGIGLERLPWLLGGGVTSYLSAFPTALTKFVELTGFDTTRLTSAAWEHFGRFSCMLNVDECGDVDAAFEEIARTSGADPESFRAEIDTVRDLYIVLDHLRSLLVAVQDGALPSNVGGGGNLRNVLRRVFAVLVSRNWLQTSGDTNATGTTVDGLYEIFKSHAIDLEAVHGPGSFPEFKSLRTILELELQRWKTTDKTSHDKLDRLVKKAPGGILGLGDWLTASTTFGISPDDIASYLN